MYCEKCGKKNDDDSKFCESCGAPLSPVSAPTPTNTVPADTNPVPTATPAFAPTRVRKPIPLMTKLIILLAIVLVAAFGVFYFIASSLSSPERMAEKFFKSVCAQDWDTVYGYCDIPEDTFTTQEMFVKSMKAGAENLSNLDVLNVDVKEAPSETMSDKLGKNYIISYTVAGSESVQTQRVTLLKQKKKSFLFFDSYKVASDDLIATNYRVSVPAGATLTVDDVAVPDTYLDSTSEDTLRDTYVLNYLFANVHTLKVTAPYAEEYTVDFTAYDDGDTTVNGLTMSEDTFQAIGKTAEEYLAAYYNAAIAGEDFSKLSAYLTTDQDQLENMAYRYERIDTVARNEDKTGLKAVTFSNFNPRTTDRSISSDLSFTYSMNFEYTYTRVKKNYSDDTLEDYTPSSSRNGRVTMQFKYENDKWVVYSSSMSLSF